ncbi:MAG: SDR family oxidoreductase [Oscillospiraceae bacterium]|jgi:NAD(P)-dependent dehydrogenase (short-subunit alcohol dehydrogenase family)|nr:SDR family oxidoreductase [Oscillospiraceae bacterium]
MITSMKNAFSVEGKNVFITGGHAGIGLGISKAFAEMGANIMIMGRRKAEGENVAAEIEKEFGVKARFYTGDLTEPGDPARVTDEAFAEFGSIDVLVNNSGLVRWFESIEADKNDFADWNDVIKLDMTAVFVMSVYAAKKMRDTGSGVIINITSNAGEIVNTPQTTVSYSASKAGVNHMTRMLAHEWAQYNIRVNAVAPGYTESKLGSAQDPEKYAKLNAEWMAKTPTHRRSKPIEIAAAVVYLASEAAQQITGEILTVDGGYKLAN